MFIGFLVLRYISLKRKVFLWSNAHSGARPHNHMQEKDMNRCQCTYPRITRESWLVSCVEMEREWANMVWTWVSHIVSQGFRWEHEHVKRHIKSKFWCRTCSHCPWCWENYLVPSIVSLEEEELCPGLELCIFLSVHLHGENRASNIYFQPCDKMYSVFCFDYVLCF